MAIPHSSPRSCWRRRAHFANNVLILNAVEDGGVTLGLINHYYWYEQVAERGPAAVPTRLKFLPGGDPCALVNVAGVGILGGSDQAAQARQFVEFLLNTPSRSYFAAETKEYPLVAGGRRWPTCRHWKACNLRRSTCPTLTPWIGPCR